MWSIVISVLSAVCLLIGALLRRHELFPAGGRSVGGPAAPDPQGATQGTIVPQMVTAGPPGLPGHGYAAPQPGFAPSGAFPRSAAFQAPPQSSLVMVVPG